MAWWNWIIENLGEIWQVVVVLAGLAIYLAKKHKDGLLADVWVWVRELVMEFVEDALQEVSQEDVWAIAGPFWDNYLSEIRFLRFFINKDKYLALCWEQWGRFVETLDAVDMAVAQRAVMGSRAFTL